MNRGLPGLELFLADRGDHLLRTAVLRTGNKQAGEDLLQAALVAKKHRGPAPGCAINLFL